MKLQEITEGVTFSNWVKPTNETLRREYAIEYEMKDLGSRLGDPFPTVEDFLDACDFAEVMTITPSEDRSIKYRSGTKSKEELISLIRTYRSYPEFRNEKTIEDIYEGFKNNKPMEMPVVLEWGNGVRRVFSGNTRMDVAFQMGINPKVLVVKF